MLPNERLESFWGGLWLELWPFLYFHQKNHRKVMEKSPPQSCERQGEVVFDKDTKTAIARAPGRPRSSRDVHFVANRAAHLVKISANIQKYTQIYKHVHKYTQIHIKKYIHKDKYLIKTISYYILIE